MKNRLEGEGVVALSETWVAANATMSTRLRKVAWWRGGQPEFLCNQKYDDECLFLSIDVSVLAVWMFGVSRLISG